MSEPNPFGFTSTPHPQANYRLAVNGRDVTTVLAGRLISLTLTDNRGFEADQLDIRLDDTDGRLDLPPRGAEVSLALGWVSSGLIDKGTYTVDEVEHSGAPDTLSIRARSADLRAGLSTQRERSWHETTLGEIVRTIAGEVDLEPAVAAELAGQAIEHIDQTNESGANLLTRLATQFDAIATVKAGKLLFMPAAHGASVSGQALPRVTIVRESGDSHRFAIADRETYTGVRALYHDLDQAVKGEEVVGKAEWSAKHEAGKGPSTIQPSAENVKTLRHVYASKANAKHAAKGEWQRLQRGMATFSITFARGRADIYPEIPATVAGFKPAIDNTDWIITRVTHNVDDNGYTTTIELEIRATEIAG